MNKSDTLKGASEVICPPHYPVRKVVCNAHLYNAHSYCIVI